MYRYFTARNTRAYLGVLPQLLNGYNGSLLRSIGIAPRDVTEKNEGVLWDKLYGTRLKRRPRPKLKVGDRVHLSKKHRLFKKGYLPGWTEEVFIVRRVRGHIQVGRMGHDALGRQFLLTGCHRSGQRLYNDVDKR